MAAAFIAMNSAASPPAAAAMGGGGGGSDTLLYEFTLENTNSGAASDHTRPFGLIFQKGDIPSGSTLVITDTSDVDVPAGIFNRCHKYADSSLNMAHVLLRDSTIAASSTRTYRAKSRSSSSYDDTDPGTNLSTLVGTGDWKVAFSSLTQYNGSTTVSRGSGDALASLTTAVSTGSVRKIVGNPFLEEWMIEEYAKDGTTGSGSADAHLKVRWHVRRVRNSDGTQKALFVTAVVCQEEIAVASKYRLNYTATFKDGSTTLDTYSSIQHPYRSTWATVRQDNDSNHARSRCVAGTDAWLICKPDKTYWSQTECFWPVDPAFTPNAISLASDVSTYQPCHNQGHRADLDAGGDYAGRGALSKFEAAAFLTPTANHYRIMRTCAMAGLHVTFHHRLPVSSSAVGTVVPLLMDTNTGADTATRWNADGLQNAIYCSSDSRTDTAYDGDYVQHTGGNGVWTQTLDASHGVPYSWFAWVMEGEEYHNQASLDLMTNLSIVGVGDAYGTRRALPWSGVGGGYAGFSGLGIPTTQWSSLPAIWVGEQERSCAWAIKILTMGAGFHPNVRIENNYVDAFVDHPALYWERGLSYAPAGLIANGIVYSREDLSSPWQQHFISMTASQAARFMELPGFVDLADFSGVYTVGSLSNNKLGATGYHGSSVKKSSAYDPTTNPFLAAADNLWCMNCTYDASANTILTSHMGTDSPNGIQNNDVVYVSVEDDSFNTIAAIGGMTQGTPYYVINKSNPSGTSIQFQVSTSPGGSALDLTGAGGNGAILVSLLGSDGGAAAFTDAGGNNFGQMALAALVMQNIRGLSGATNALVDDTESWLSGVSYADLAKWKLKRF